MDHIKFKWLLLHKFWCAVKTLNDESGPCYIYLISEVHVTNSAQWLGITQTKDTSGYQQKYKSS
jgi:hypothetical protein